MGKVDNHSQEPNHMVFACNFSLISLTGLWSTSFYLGNFLGPTISGVLVDYFGFPTTATVFAGLALLNVFIDLNEFFFVARKLPAVE